jgi:hypothetical protein
MTRTFCLLILLISLAGCSSPPVENTPLGRPFDLNAPHASQPRDVKEAAATRAAYEKLLACSSANLRVVTSQDIVQLAQQVIP